MGYTRVNNDLSENGVAVDLLSDGTLFVKIRASRSKKVEAERVKQQAPYKNILLGGRSLPPGVAREIGQKITAYAVIAGVAGELPDGTKVGIVTEGRPTSFESVDPDKLIALFNDFPDFEEDISGASQLNVTFAQPGIVDSTGERAPGTPEAAELATGN